MSFYYDNTTQSQRDEYDQMLIMMGSLSNLFSESDKPYLPSRFTENAFCRCLKAENLSRGDVTADAMKNHVGIGIKTWINSDLQKIAEFNSLKPTYENDSDPNMIAKIARYRNERIQFTKRTYDLNSMIYHCTIRDIGKITIIECPLEEIDIKSIRNIHRKKNVIAFDDGINKYSFNTSKSTLYKRFDKYEIIKTLSVKIIDDPYIYLASRIGAYSNNIMLNKNDWNQSWILLDTAILPLYSTRRGVKYVPPKNNLNMRFAGGRKRDIYEIGIPIPSAFRTKCPDFFPGIENPFRLKLPNGKELIAKQCQQDGKSLMSNPNKALGHWMIDDVLRIDPYQEINYDMLNKYGIDSVRLEKIKDTKSHEVYYTINFARTGSYELFMEGESIDVLDSVDEY